MPHEIKQKERFVEIHVTGRMSHWDILKIVHELQKSDPHKEKPDLWVLEPELDLPLHSFPRIVQGILTLVARHAVKGCKSAILAADEFQRMKVELYCFEATSLPYKIRSFTSRQKATDWLLS